MNIIKDILYFNIRQVHRLVTHEDGAYFHMHKILGGLAMLNFSYRLWHWSIHGTLGLSSSYTTLYWIGIHMALHISSFEFAISNRKNKVYNIIWPEMRWHSMFFAYRSLIILFITWLYEKGLTSYTLHYLRGPLVVFTMIMADFVTKKYKYEDTTMRGNPYPSYVPPFFIKTHNLFYSISQVFATMNMLFKGKDLAFLSLIPIQTAPFCMTLVKKGIINQMGWHIYYTIAILMNYVYAFYDDIYVPWFKEIVVFFVIYRFGFSWNKYLLWSVPITFQLYMLTYHSKHYLTLLE